MTAGIVWLCPQRRVSFSFNNRIVTRDVHRTGQNLSCPDPVLSWFRTGRHLHVLKTLLGFFLTPSIVKFEKKNSFGSEESAYNMKISDELDQCLFLSPKEQRKGRIITILQIQPQSISILHSCKLLFSFSATTIRPTLKSNFRFLDQY